MLIYYASFDHIGEKLIKLQLPIFNHFPIDFIPWLLIQTYVICMRVGKSECIYRVLFMFAWRHEFIFNFYM